jgi:serine/threonine-protein kinase TTK/MPS1
VPHSLRATLQRCLNRDQHQRPSATELLHPQDPFLNPIEYDPSNPAAAAAFPMTEELLGRILYNVALKCKTSTPADSDVLNVWPKGYLDSLRRKLLDGKHL